MYTQLNQYHVVMEVGARVLAEPRRRCSDVYVHAAGGRAGAAHRVRPLRDRPPRRCRSTTQGQFPSVTISFNLPPGVALGDAVDAIERGGARAAACRRPSTAASPGTAQAFQASLANEPLLIAAALLTVYIVLGILYESLIHPITILSTLPSAGVGALLALLRLPLPTSP